MPLQEQQDLLARLYTDREFQSKFLADPGSHANDLGLSAADAKSLAASAANEVRWFADSLVNKRLREVVKMLPLTYREVGATAFEEAFRNFAAEFSPFSTKKHLEDALAFSDWLRRGDLDASARTLVQFDSRRLRHNSNGKALSACLLRRDPRTPTNEGIGLWLAVKGWSRIFFLPNRDD